MEPQDGLWSGLAFGSKVPHLYVGLLLKDEGTPPPPRHLATYTHPGMDPGVKETFLGLMEILSQAAPVAAG